MALLSVPTCALLAGDLAPQTCFAHDVRPAGSALRFVHANSAPLTPVLVPQLAARSTGVQSVLADPDLLCLAGASLDSCCLSQDLGFRFGGTLSIRIG